MSYESYGEEMADLVRHVGAKNAAKFMNVSHSNVRKLVNHKDATIDHKDMIISVLFGMGSVGLAFPFQLDVVQTRLSEIQITASGGG